VTPQAFRRIGVVGTGVIGAGWAAYYLARGFDVAATDPAPGAEAALRALVGRMWVSLRRIGLADGASLDRLTFDAELSRALDGVDFVQENAPERLELKRRLLRDISAAVRDDVIIATSSSGLLVSEIQDAATHPERVVLGHPFNPPHLIPLVEVVGGRRTSATVIEATLDFYRSIGKQPIHLRREVKGHVANRLQAALWREAFYLLDQGVATVADIDAAIAHGPGLRWALLGPFINLHLSGGAGGIGHMIDHLGPAIEDWWRDLGELTIDAELRAKLVDGVRDELSRVSVDVMTDERDALLIDLLGRKAVSTSLP
jgi:carnitine 3-dehydrogenase